MAHKKNKSLLKSDIIKIGQDEKYNYFVQFFNANDIIQFISAHDLYFGKIEDFIMKQNGYNDLYSELDKRISIANGCRIVDIPNERLENYRHELNELNTNTHKEMFLKNFVFKILCFENMRKLIQDFIIRYSKKYTKYTSVRIFSEEKEPKNISNLKLITHHP